MDDNDEVDAYTIVDDVETANDSNNEVSSASDGEIKLAVRSEKHLYGALCGNSTVQLDKTLLCPATVDCCSVPVTAGDTSTVSGNAADLPNNDAALQHGDCISEEFDSDLDHCFVVLDDADQESTDDTHVLPLAFSDSGQKRIATEEVVNHARQECNGASEGSEDRTQSVKPSSHKMESKQLASLCLPKRTPQEQFRKNKVNQTGGKCSTNLSKNVESFNMKSSPPPEKDKVAAAKMRKHMEALISHQIAEAHGVLGQKGKGAKQGASDIEHTAAGPQCTVLNAGSSEEAIIDEIEQFESQRKAVESILNLHSGTCFSGVEDAHSKSDFVDRLKNSSGRKRNLCQPSSKLIPVCGDDRSNQTRNVISTVSKLTSSALNVKPSLSVKPFCNDMPSMNKKFKQDVEKDSHFAGSWSPADGYQAGGFQHCNIVSSTVGPRPLEYHNVPVAFNQRPPVQQQPIHPQPGCLQLQQRPNQPCIVGPPGDGRQQFSVRPPPEPHGGQSVHTGPPGCQPFPVGPPLRCSLPNSGPPGDVNKPFTAHPPPSTSSCLALPVGPPACRPISVGPPGIQPVNSGPPGGICQSFTPGPHLGLSGCPPPSGCQQFNVGPPGCLPSNLGVPGGVGQSFPVGSSSVLPGCPSRVDPQYFPVGPPSIQSQSTGLCVGPAAVGIAVSQALPGSAASFQMSTPVKQPPPVPVGHTIDFSVPPPTCQPTPPGIQENSVGTPVNTIDFSVPPPTCQPTPPGIQENSVGTPVNTIDFSVPPPSCQPTPPGIQENSVGTPVNTIDFSVPPPTCQPTPPGIQENSVGTHVNQPPPVPAGPSGSQLPISPAVGTALPGSAASFQISSPAKQPPPVPVGHTIDISVPPPAGQPTPPGIQEKAVGPPVMPSVNQTAPVVPPSSVSAPVNLQRPAGPSTLPTGLPATAATGTLGTVPYRPPVVGGYFPPYIAPQPAVNQMYCPAANWGPPPAFVGALPLPPGTTAPYADRRVPPPYWQSHFPPPPGAHFGYGQPLYPWMPPPVAGYNPADLPATSGEAESTSASELNPLTEAARAWAEKSKDSYESGAAHEWAEWSRKYTEWYNTYYGTGWASTSSSAEVQTTATTCTASPAASVTASKKAATSGKSKIQPTDSNAVSKTSTVSRFPAASETATSKVETGGKSDLVPAAKVQHTASNAVSKSSATPSSVFAAEAHKTTLHTSSTSVPCTTEHSPSLNTSTSTEVTANRPIHATSSVDAAGTSLTESTTTTNLVINNLPVGTKAIDVKMFLSKYGKVVNCKVGTMKSQKDVDGLFSLVVLETTDDAASCIANLHETEFRGRTISLYKMNRFNVGFAGFTPYSYRGIVSS